MDLLQLVLAGVSTGSIYALIALGFNVVFKATDAINFAQGEWVMMGGMVAASLYAAGRLPLVAAIIGALAVVAAVGLVSDWMVVRRLRRSTPLMVTLTTIGLAICAKSLVMLLLGKNPAGLPGFSGDQPILIGAAAVQPQSLWIVLITAVAMLLAQWFFGCTAFGKAMRAAAAQPDAAALVGIDPQQVRLVAFGLAAAAGALAGVIITPLTLTSYDHGTVLGFKGFSAAMLGGLGSLPGALIGGLGLGLLESLASGLVSSKFKDAVAFVVLLVVLFGRPAGLLGRGEVQRV
jgi:branched-chain amino acid transport system permease protein